MPKTVKRRKNKLAGRYRNRWPDEAEISGRMIPKWVADSCRNRWPDHPEICNNNTAERSLRPIALGRKNYLFAGSVAGGERAAVIYTLLGSAKLNGLNPTEYLSCVLRRIGNYPINRLAELLPWNIDLTPIPGEAL